MSTRINTSAGLWVDPPLTATQESEPHIGLGSTPASFPSVVATVAHTGQTGNLSFDLLPTPVTGDYVLNDYLSFTTGDPNGAFEYTLSWEEDGGVVRSGTNGSGSNEGTISWGATAYSNTSQLSTAPTTLRLASGTPLHVDMAVTGTGVQSASPSAGAAGLLYAPGDTGLINTGSSNAVYQVLTVGAGGVVLTVSITYSGPELYDFVE